MEIDLAQRLRSGVHAGARRHSAVAPVEGGEGRMGGAKLCLLSSP